MKLGLNLELALLPPGHAHNLTDAFFARVNGLFDKTKQNSRLVGSHAYVLSVRRCARSVSFLPCTHVHAATDSAVTPVRDLITNVTVLHRQLDTPIPPVPILHGQVKHGDVLFGVKKFIRFEFSVILCRPPIFR